MEQATVFDLVESRAIRKESFIRINRKETQLLALKKQRNNKLSSPFYTQNSQFFLANLHAVRSFSFDIFKCQTSISDGLVLMFCFTNEKGEL